VPAKTPDDIKSRLYAETRKALDTPALREKLARLGIDPLELNSEQFSKLVRDEIEINTGLAKAAGLRVN
jgi:tripartite-type tricarboxylate transporter receptor subunit TctC